MPAKLKVEPVFEVWLRKEHPLVLPTGDHLKMLRLAFYTGCWLTLGYIQKLDLLSDNDAIEFISEMTKEVKSVVKEKS